MRAEARSMRRPAIMVSLLYLHINPHVMQRVTFRHVKEWVLSQHCSGSVRTLRRGQFSSIQCRRSTFSMTR